MKPFQMIQLNVKEKRLVDLEKLFRAVFEQLALANLSETQFKALTGGYEEEKQELTIRSEMLEQKINAEKDRMLNADRFLKVVQRYTELQELTPEVVRELTPLHLKTKKQGPPKNEEPCFDMVQKTYCVTY